MSMATLAGGSNTSDSGDLEGTVIRLFQYTCWNESDTTIGQMDLNFNIISVLV